MTMAKTLVTGASGFLGSHLIERLDPHALRVLVRESRPEGDVEVVEGSVLDPEAVARAVDGVEHRVKILSSSALRGAPAAVGGPSPITHRVTLRIYSPFSG